MQNPISNTNADPDAEPGHFNGQLFFHRDKKMLNVNPIPKFRKPSMQISVNIPFKLSRSL